MLNIMLDHYRHTYRSSDSVENWIKLALDTTSGLQFVCWHHSEIDGIGTRWAFVDEQPHEDYSDLVDISNWHCITQDMHRKYPRQTDFESSYFAIQLLTKRGKPTQAALAFYDILARLDDYPLYNDEDHSKREFELECEGNEQSIRDFARFGSVGEYPDRLSIETRPDIPENYVDTVLQWLVENDSEAIERSSMAYHGDKNSVGWINDSSLLAAFYALGYLDLEYHAEDISEIEAYLAQYVMDGYGGIRSAFRGYRAKITD